MKIVNTYVPGLSHHGVDDRANLMIVLTQDETGLYAAYMGIVNLDHRMKLGAYNTIRRNMAYLVASNGMKLNYNMARGFFPSLTQEEYRA